MTLTTFNRNSLWVAALLLFFFTTFYSCKKIDTPTAKQLYTEKFFEKPSNSSPELQAIIDLLKTENDKTGFINLLPDNAGLPVWNKIIARNSNTNYAARRILVDQKGNYLISLSNDNQTLSGLLFAMNKDDKYIFFYYDNYYAYSVAFSDKFTIKERENVMGLFMSMSNYVFDITEFKSIPIELFPGINGKIEEGGNTKKMFLEPLNGTSPIVLSDLGIVGTEETCVYKFSGQCNCTGEVLHNASQCVDWYSGCGFCSLSDCQLLFFEEVPGNDPPPSNPNGGTAEEPSNGTSGWNNGMYGPGGPLPYTENGPLPNAPCNNCAWYTQATDYEFESDPNNPRPGDKLCSESFNLVEGSNHSYWETNMQGLKFEGQNIRVTTVNTFSAYYNFPNDIKETTMQATISNSPFGPVAPSNVTTASDYLHDFFPDLFTSYDIQIIWDATVQGNVWRFSKYAVQKIATRASNLASLDVRARFPDACATPGFIPAQIEFRKQTQRYLRCFIPLSVCQLSPSSSSNNSTATYSQTCN